MNAVRRRHVNRKALDEYASFTEQKTELKRRQEENARGEAKIKQLIQTLDLRKDEAIERTFKVGRAASAGSSSPRVTAPQNTMQCPSKEPLHMLKRPSLPK